MRMPKEEQRQRACQQQKLFTLHLATIQEGHEELMIECSSVKSTNSINNKSGMSTAAKPRGIRWLMQAIQQPLDHNRESRQSKKLRKIAQRQIEEQNSYLYTYRLRWQEQNSLSLNDNNASQNELCFTNQHHASSSRKDENTLLQQRRLRFFMDHEARQEEIARTETELLKKKKKEHEKYIQ
jgi:hypothetical protein